jgi:hypothetical protein
VHSYCIQLQTFLQSDKAWETRMGTWPFNRFYQNSCSRDSRCWRLGFRSVVGFWLFAAVCRVVPWSVLMGPVGYRSGFGVIGFALVITRSGMECRCIIFAIRSAFAFLVDQFI